MRHDLVTTLDLEAGMVVMCRTALVKIAEVREPTHPALPGVIVDMHYYSDSERRWDERTVPLNIPDVTRPFWYAVPDDVVPTMPDERYDVPDNMAAWRYGDEITVRQFRQWIDEPYWHTDARGMTRIAARAAMDRDGDPNVTCVSSSVFGVGRREVWERRYKI